MANVTMDNGIRLYISDDLDTDGFVNVMASVPAEAYGLVWRMAHWFQVGSVTTTGVNSRGRLAASFKDVDGYTIESLVNHMDN